jgi:hypothetical protein
LTYENRLTVNFAFGTLTNAAAISDTSLVSTDFAAPIPSGLSTTTYVPITLQDPASKVFEVVWATGHTGGSSTVTVVRGREGTTTRSWGSGTLWAVTPTLRDGLFPVPTRAALPTDWHVGLRCYVQDEQITLERSLAAWIFSGGHLLAQKTADESVASSTALQNDDHLFLPVQAGALYELHAWLLYTGAADPAGGLSIDWTLPAAAGMQWTYYGVLQNTSPALLTYDTVVLSGGGTRPIGTNGATVMSLQPKGYVITGANAGTLQMRWAQAISHATATVLKTGSFVRLIRLG